MTIEYVPKYNKRNKRWTVMKHDTEKRGFAAWRIVKGGFKTQAEAQTYIDSL